MGVPRLIGMVHLHALPGAPGFDGHLDGVVAAAVADARVIADAGFDGIMTENFGDIPFYADDVPKVTVAAMTRVARAIREATPLPLGINVLRNDVSAALSVAAAVDAQFVRVNVLAGTMYTDQGLIVGKAAEVLRLRAAIAPEVAVMADVFVKHAVPPPGLQIEGATSDLAGRGGADAIVVSGPATGSAPDFDRIKTVKGAAGEVPVYVGSGASVVTARSMLDVADGLIVGTAIKIDGVTTNPVDLGMARRLVAAAS